MRRRAQLQSTNLISPYHHEIERLHWAFVCYNTDEVAEFVLRGPTPVVSAGEQVGTYIDYSNVRRVPIKNTFYAARR